jgi:hypothetical protein
MFYSCRHCSFYTALLVLCSFVSLAIFSFVMLVICSIRHACRSACHIAHSSTFIVPLRTFTRITLQGTAAIYFDAKLKLPSASLDAWKANYTHVAQEKEREKAQRAAKKKLAGAMSAATTAPPQPPPPRASAAVAAPLQPLQPPPPPQPVAPVAPPPQQPAADAVIDLT